MSRANRLSRVGLCAGVLMSHAALTGSAHAQAKEKATPAAPSKEAAQPSQQTPGWSVNCANTGKALACKAQQTIIMAKTRQLLLRLSISRAEDGKSMSLLFQLPHGLFNPAGVSTEIDAAPAETLPIQTCDAGGCYAGSPLPPEKLAAMTKGTSLKVTFQDLKKQKITVPVPLKGLEDAVKKL